MLAQSQGARAGARKRPRAKRIGKDVNWPRLQGAIGRQERIQTGGTIGKCLRQQAQVAEVHAVLGMRPVRLIKEPEVMHGKTLALGVLQVSK